VATQLSEPIQFGKYTLFERIGRGGMAEVYKGRIQGPAGFERVFVVKRILPHLSDDASFIKMFVEEAKLSARLNHPNIVHIFELGAVEGEYFISMEYIRGHDLSETMRSIWKALGPPRPELVAYIGREACRGLAYAHNLTDENGRPLGMIHRDVSPSNVMLSYEGAVKMLDFGIAKALGDAEPSKSGTLKGKYAYMAPEQTEGDNIDNRSDIFAIGIVLHEVLTGRRLFKGQNDVQTIERVRRCEVPPPSAQNAAVPRELDHILLKALQRDPARRWSNAADMADALDDIVHSARFQPTHLQQILYDLFPPEGGAPAPRTGSNRSLSRSTTASGQSMRSQRTVPPISRTVSGANPIPQYAAQDSAPASLKPKGKFPTAAVAVVVLAAAGFGGWKFLGGKRGPDTRITQVGDPNRKFHVYVKSSPDGADIFLGESKRPIGATPVTLPIDLTGVTSVKLTLKKAGYEDYEQIVVDDTPLSISLTAIGAPPPAPAGAGGAPAPAPDQAGGSKEKEKSSSGSGKSRHRGKKSSGSSDEPTGEITE
jgi:serine/threonine protein kinase